MFRILLPLDGSANSDRALDFALRLREVMSDAAELHLLNVQLPVSLGHIKLFIGHEEIVDYQRSEGLAALQPVREKLDRLAIPYRHHIVVGPTAETVVRFATEHRYNMIVMGTRGAGTLSQLLLGSTATRVVQLAEVPVTLVK
jgi:nucleotide-binding universal stress UspA family protein